MDNFHIDITCEHRTMFDAAIEIGFRQNENPDAYAPKPQTATHYVIHPEHGLLFLWGGGDNSSIDPRPVAFPFPFGHKQAADMAWEWLTKHVVYPDKDHNDSDVSEHPGWRVYNEEWGHVGDYTYAIVAIQPAWAWYGK